MLTDKVFSNPEHFHLTACFQTFPVLSSLPMICRLLWPQQMFTMGLGNSMKIYEITSTNANQPAQKQTPALSLVCFVLFCSSTKLCSLAQAHATAFWAARDKQLRLSVTSLLDDCGSVTACSVTECSVTDGVLHSLALCTLVASDCLFSCSFSALHLNP